MNILITGGTGFIGSHLRNFLCQLEYCVDFFPKEDFVKKDFRKLRSRYDLVVHAAWIRERDIHSLRHLEFAKDTCEFFDACKNAGLRVLNLGTHNEYGVKFSPASETDICEPIDTYGIAKLAVTLYAKKLGFNTLRLFAVTGEGGKQFPNIAETSLKYSHPENVKDFIPVSLVCRAIERIIHAKHLYGEVINVASGKQLSASEIVKDINPEFFDRFYRYQQRQYEPSIWVGNPEKMVKLLNLKP